MASNVDEENVAANVLVCSETEPVQLHYNDKPVYIIRNNKGKLQDVPFEEPTEEVLAALEGHLEHHHFDTVEIKQEYHDELSNDADYITEHIIHDTSITPKAEPGPITYQTIEVTEVEEPEDNSLVKNEDQEEIIEYVLAEEYEDPPVDEVQVALDHDYGDTEAQYTEFFCGVCGKSFLTERSVNMHMTRVHATRAPSPTMGLAAPDARRPKGPKQKTGSRPKTCVCEVCGKNYASNAALRYHQRVHTGEKPYCCLVCEKRFTMPLFLQIHSRIHTGERPYACHLCPKAFGNRAALLRHDRVHTGIKPYPCPECGKTFTQSNSMKLHVKTVHLKLPAPYKSRARRLKDLERQERFNKTEAETTVIDEALCNVLKKTRRRPLGHKKNVSVYRVEEPNFQGVTITQVYPGSHMVFKQSDSEEETD